MGSWILINFIYMNSTIYRVGNDNRPNYLDLKKPQTTYADLKKQGTAKEYIQSKYINGKNACSLFGAINPIANNYNVDFSDEDLQLLINEAIDTGILKSWGGYMDKSAYFVCSWVKRNKGLDLLPTRIGWREFRGFASLGWGICTGYQGKEGLWQDKMDMELGNEEIKWGAVKYGHLISIWNFYHFFLLSRMYILDNYGKDYKYNNVKLNHKGFSDLVADGIMFPSGFYFEEK